MQLCPAQGRPLVGHMMAAVCQCMFEFSQDISLKVHPGGSGHIKITSLEHTGDQAQNSLRPGFSLRWKDGIEDKTDNLNTEISLQDVL